MGVARLKHGACLCRHTNLRLDFADCTSSEVCRMIPLFWQNIGTIEWSAWEGHHNFCECLWCPVERLRMHWNMKLPAELPLAVNHTVVLTLSTGLSCHFFHGVRLRLCVCVCARFVSPTWSPPLVQSLQLTFVGETTYFHYYFFISWSVQH